ncbi:hypothetical protein N431DRAFT_363885 [Stipitochalara longipes BDJ]|nr:hypothetical protein N431DRAFT_363885 [Stipitochalara longipes BDJ]
MERPSVLQTVGEKALHQTADPDLITYCPSMDLVALVTIDQQVFIYRLNGQRVYGATQKTGNLRVDRIRWKPNGQLLAIAWSDGSVRLVGAESSKIVHQFTAGDMASGVTCMDWVTNLTNKSASSISGGKDLGSWDTFLMGDGILSDEKSPLDLPRDLSLIDIETSLPKLSVLAAAGSSDDVFSSRQSLDAIFRPFDPKDNAAVDVMVVGTREGTIHLSIYDSFVIGSFPSPVVVDHIPAHLARHASHEKYSTHSLLMRSAASDHLFLVPMDLRFISASSQYLSLLASRSTAFQNLLRYIHQVQLLMVSEWKASQELPSRFLRNINETLGEKDNGDIVQALYHSVATGHTFPSVREWLVDELSERGHKRWDKAVTTGLENLRRLVHENMLPALDRCSVILSRFAGIAKFQGSNETVGFSIQQINLIMDTVACLHLISSKILVQVVDELDLFAAFSSWVRYEIDRLASDSSASPDDDKVEKEASIDHSKVLLYLQTAMTNSPLAMYFDDSLPDDHDNSWNNAEQGLPIYDLLDKQLQKQERGAPYMKTLPRVDLLCKLLARQASTVFSQIAEAEKRNVIFGKVYEIGLAETAGPLDMRMSTVDTSACRTHITFVPKGYPNIVQVIRLGLFIENGISQVQTIDSALVQLGDGTIKDIKFMDDNLLLVLWDSSGTRSLLRLFYDNIPADPGALHLKYSTYMQNGGPYSPTVFSNEDVKARLSRYQIHNLGSFIPERMEYRKRSQGREKIDTRRLVLLRDDKLHYKVFKFAEAAGADGDTPMS